MGRRWRLETTRRGGRRLSMLLPGVQDVLPAEVDDLDGWLDGEDIPDGTPFLVSPQFEYDVDLNGYFLRSALVGAAWNTQIAAARDIRRFLDFLWLSRDGRSWREATEADHDAYVYWRRHDPAGPRVAGAALDRELAMLNGFYGWAYRRGLVPYMPIPQRPRRVVRQRENSVGPPTTAAARSHDACRDLVRWLTPEQYRRWRDVGLRGYGTDGLPEPGFRGRWAARNAAFADLMVRTGLRLTEQASLTVGELPAAGGSAYHRFWLPAAVAKGRSARWVYVPDRVARLVAEYMTVDRADVVAQARSSGSYDETARWLVVDEDRGGTPSVLVNGCGGPRWVPVNQLTPWERARLLVRAEAGLEPAGLWLNEQGMPLSASGWKQIFRSASRRCAERGMPIDCHPHLLRHSFAVVTLEQLQRGHVAALAAMTVEQRGYYQKVFGDPLDWVRRRLGHRSVETTMIYLDALQELEMHARMALVAAWRTAHPGEDIPDGQVFTQPWAGLSGNRRDQVVYYQYRADRARRTLRGIDEQIAKAEKAVTGKTAIKTQPPRPTPRRHPQHQPGPGSQSPRAGRAEGLRHQPDDLPGRHPDHHGLHDRRLPPAVAHRALVSEATTLTRSARSRERIRSASANPVPAGIPPRVADSAIASR
jgi:site-specific recombinase XerD